MDKNEYLITLSESNHTDFGKIDFAEQNDTQKTFSAIWELESQVNNGGFEQYFRNSDLDIIIYAPEALRKIGANACSDIIKDALEIISPILEENNNRIHFLEEAFDKDDTLLDELDSRFYSYPDNLTELLFRYVSTNQDEFGEITKFRDELHKSDC